MSSKDGRVVRNLTAGFDKDTGFDYISQLGGFRNNAVPWMAWSPTGDRLAYFVRTEKERTLIIQNVLTRQDRASASTMKTVDEPESPDFSPDGTDGRRSRRCAAPSATSSSSISTPGR